MGVNVLGPSSHVILFEATDPFADGGFDFSLCFHGGLERVPILGQRPAPAKPAHGHRTEVISYRGTWITSYQRRNGETTMHLLFPLRGVEYGLNGALLRFKWAPRTAGSKSSDD